jgi:uncharacterized membrane protein required for colicin V production
MGDFDISMIISLIIGFFTVVGALIGLKRGLIKSALRIATVIASVVIAFVLVEPISNIIAPKIEPIISDLMNDVQEIQQIMESSPSAKEVISRVPFAIASSIIYVLLFICLSTVLLIVYKILSSILSPKGTKKGIISRLGGLGIGAVQVLVVSFVVTMPIVGILGLVNDAVDKIEEIDSTATNELIASPDFVTVNDGYIRPISENIFINAFTNLGAEKMFNNLTSFELNGEKVVLSDEIMVVIEGYSYVTPLLETPFEEYSDVQASSVKSLVEVLGKSNMLPSMLAELLSGATGTWLEGESFAGIAKPDGGEVFGGFFDSVFEIFSTCTKDTLTGDLTTLADIFAALAENNIFKNFNNTEELFKVLSSEDVIKEITAPIYTNERMKGLIPEIYNVGFRAFTSSLEVEIPTDIDTVYEDVMGSLSDTIKNSNDLTEEERQEALGEELDAICGQYQLDIPDSVKEQIVSGIVSDIVDYEDINEDTVAELFLIYAMYAQGTGNIIPPIVENGAN